MIPCRQCDVSRTAGGNTAMSIRSIAAVLALGLLSSLAPAGAGQSQTTAGDKTITFGELLMRIQFAQIYDPKLPIPDTIQDAGGWMDRFNEMRERSIKEGAEVGIAGFFIDRGGTSIFRLVPPIVGEENSVDVRALQEAVDARTGNPKTPLVLVAHTHPENSTFSPPDVLIATMNKSAMVVINSRHTEMVVPTASVSDAQYYAGFFLTMSDWTDRIKCGSRAAGSEQSATFDALYEAAIHDLIASYGVTYYRWNPATTVWNRMALGKPNVKAYVASYRTGIPDATRMTINELGNDESLRRIRSGAFGAAVQANIGRKYIDFVIAATGSKDKVDIARLSRVSQSSGLTSRVFQAVENKICSSNARIDITDAQGVKSSYTVRSEPQGLTVTKI